MMTTHQNIFVELANGLQIPAVLKTQDAPGINASAHVEVAYARAGSIELMHFESSSVGKRTGKQAGEIVMQFAEHEAQRLATRVLTCRLGAGALLNAGDASALMPAGVALVEIGSGA